MHDGFGVLACDTTSSVSRETIKDTFPNLFDYLEISREASQTSVSFGFLIDGSDLVLQAFRKQLEELLCILVFARVKEGICAAFDVSEDVNDIYGTDRVVGRSWSVQF